MLKIVKTKWRPFIELTELLVKDGTATETGCKFYLNALKVPDGIVSCDQYTSLIYESFVVCVKESAKEIFKTIDKMVDAEADRKAKQAAEYMAATESRVANFKKD